VSKRKRRIFERDFKEQAVRLVLEEGRSVSSVAKSLDIYPSSLGDWVKQARPSQAQGKVHAMNQTDLDELRRLRAENRQLKTEREILKKAAEQSIGRRNTPQARWTDRNGEEKNQAKLLGGGAGRPLAKMEKRRVAKRHRQSAATATRNHPYLPGWPRWFLAAKADPKPTDVVRSGARGDLKANHAGRLGASDCPRTRASSVDDSPRDQAQWRTECLSSCASRCPRLA